MGDYRHLSSDERAYLDAQERCWTGFRWPGRDRDRRPAWRPRPPDAFPILDGLICSIPATDLIQCPALISLLRYKWTSEGWQDPLGGPVIDPWQEEDYAAFDDEDFSAWDFDHA